MKHSQNSRPPFSYLRLDVSQPVLDAAQDWLPIVAPPPTLTVSQWADRERYLSEEDSAEPGKWHTSRAEYQRAIMDAFNDPAVETVVVESSVQVGKTQIILNVTGYYIDQDPGPILVIEPDEDTAEEFSVFRFDPMVRDTPALTRKVSKQASRSKSNTIKRKSFPGGRLALAWANSPASLAGRPIRIVLGDEIDRYPLSAKKEGDPFTLGIRRTQNFWNRKIGAFSSPGIKGSSRIDALYQSGDRRRFHVPCAHCGAMQVMKWAQVKWSPPYGDGSPWSARYVCEHCGEPWSEGDRVRAIGAGEWRASAPFSGIASFHLWEAMSPWAELGKMAKAFLDAKGKPEEMKVFVNTVLGEPYELRPEEVDSNQLYERAKASAWKETDPAPSRVLLVTGSADVQGDRIEIERVGWGLEEESWSLQHEIFYGDLSAPEIWNRLQEYIDTPTKTADGRELPVLAFCVDSGGHYTEQVYRFCEHKAGRRIYAIKGFPGPKPIWPKRGSQTKKAGGWTFFPIGVDSAKDMVMARLAKSAGPGACHFPSDRDIEYFRQLTSEYVETKWTAGVPTRTWQRRANMRNEALDLRVYAYAALRSMRINWGAVQAEVEKMKAKPVEEKQPEPQPFNEPPPPKPPSSKGVVTVRSPFMRR